MKKKIISKILSLLVVFSLIPSFAFASGDLGNVKSARRHMAAMGLDADYIKDLPDNEVLKYQNTTLASKKDEYFKFDYTVEYDETLKKDVIKNTKKTKINKDEAYKLAKEADKNFTQRSMDILKNNPLNADVVMLAGYGDGYNITTQFGIMKLETWAFYQSGNTYLISTRFEWLNAIAGQVSDMLSLCNDTKGTKLQNTSYFIAKCDKTRKDIYGNSSVQIVTIKESTTPTKEEITGIGYSYYIPPNYEPISSREWYENTGVRGYLTYYMAAPQASVYGVLGSYGHQSSNVNWGLSSFSVSFPVGLSITMPELQQVTEVGSTYVSFSVT